MKGLAVFLFFVVALASAKVVDRHYETKTADPEFLQKQKDIFQLLYHVHQPNTHTEQAAAGQEYSIESNMEHYSNPQSVKFFLTLYEQGLLPKGKIFSILYTRLTEEAEALFKVMYYAKDYDTFIKTLYWAREHVNEQMFVYACSVAVLHRPDTQGVILPPPYEILPTYFFPTEVIDQAYKVKMQGHGSDLSHHIHTDDKVVTISSNYSGWYVHQNPEQKLSYFTEDIGLNSFYYYHHLDYPFWMNGEEFGLKKDGRGEIFYYIHKQLLARYYMERLSHGLGEIPEFSWDWPVETGYYPSLKYHNGLEYPHRPNHFDLKKEEFLGHLTQVKDYERRIREAIDQGYLVKRDGTKVSLREPKSIEHLANVVESNDDSVNLRLYRYPLTISKMLLGNSPTPQTWHSVAPSALEHFQTCLRDPVFYQLHKRSHHYFSQFQEWLTPYTKEELLCPGVKIESVEVDKLITYMDHHDVDITNVVHQTKDEAEKLNDDLEIRVRQTRLNHKPFTVSVKVDSEKPTKVVIRTFIGPKYDGLGNILRIDDNRDNFIVVDKFVYDLKSGKNVVERNSREFAWSIKDWTPSKVQYRNLLEAIEGNKEFHLDMSEAHTGFPDRLVLPRGRRGGMPFYVYVIISPYNPPKVPQGTGYNRVVSAGVGSGAYRVDSLPLGYPFDRPITDENVFYTNNMHFEDVAIFHKRESEVNTTSQE